MDGADHLVTDEDMTVGMKRGAGAYRTLCGAVVLAAPMVAPPEPACERCLAATREPTDPTPVAEPPPRRRPGWLARLFGGRG